MRFIAAVIGGGIMDRYPNLRVGTLNAGLAGCRSGAAAWTSSMRMSASTAPLKMKPSEYLSSGRYFCSVERHAGPDMYDAVTRFLGDDVLMYASDYPHSECQFPETVSNFLAWNVRSEARRKLMGGNADRFFRQANAVRGQGELWERDAPA